MNLIEELKNQLRYFAEERDRDQFRSPKNLSMAPIAESAELVEHFQWLTEEQSKALSADKLAEDEQELPDIKIYLIRISEKRGVDLLEAVSKKIELYKKKYPAEKVRGSAKIFGV